MAQLFGTDGIRGRAGDGFFTRFSLARFGALLTQWLQKRDGAEHLSLILLHDTRISCDWVKQALMSGILEYPITVADAGVLPTPAAPILLSAFPYFSAAIIISASHNPYYDNGIKIFTRSGKLTEQEENELETLFYDATLTGNGTGSFGSYRSFHKTAEHLYCSRILGLVPPRLLQGLTIALDCANGATSFVAPNIFKELGATVVATNTEPDGININHGCGSLEPKQVRDVVLLRKAGLGFAFDGDGDRVIAATGEGEIKDGDDLLVLLSRYSPYRDVPTIVGTALTNVGCERHFAQQGKALLRAPIGDRAVAHELKTRNLPLGGEPAGHLILADLLPVGDGILAALKVIESIRETDNWTLQTCNKFPQAHRNIITLHHYKLSEPPFAELIRAAELKTAGGRILVRYSGTEPLLRIMVEAGDQELAQTTAESLAQSFFDLFQQKQRELL